LSIYRENPGWGNSQETYPITRENMKYVFQSRTREWLLDLFREGVSPKTLEVIQSWVVEAGMYEVAGAIQTVQREVAYCFVVFFTHGGIEGNQATVARFVNREQKTRYHVDYWLTSGETGAILNMHLDEEGEWFTDTDMGNPLVISPIGAQIVQKERLQIVIHHAEIITPEENAQPHPEGQP